MGERIRLMPAKDMHMNVEKKVIVFLPIPFLSMLTWN
jgi:hypothetical protein